MLKNSKIISVIEPVFKEKYYSSVISSIRIESTQRNSLFLLTYLSHAQKLDKLTLPSKKVHSLFLHF